MAFETRGAEAVETGENLDGSFEDLKTHRTVQRRLEFLHLFPEIGRGDVYGIERIQRGHGV